MHLGCNSCGGGEGWLCSVSLLVFFFFFFFSTSPPGAARPKAIKIKDPAVWRRKRSPRPTNPLYILDNNKQRGCAGGEPCRWGSLDTSAQGEINNNKKKKKGRGREMSKGMVSSAATHALGGKFQAEEVAFRCSANLPCENVHDQSRGPIYWLELGPQRNLPL